MASPIVYTLAPMPHWVIIDAFSKLPTGAAIYTYRSLDPSQFKAAFQDSAGQIPYGQPIDGFGNGTFPPIFWAFDPNNPNETYYIQAWSARKENGGVFLWDFNGISGGGSGGGGSTTSSYDIENLVVNNVFFRNIGNQLGPLPGSLVLAPGQHEGFVNDPLNPNVTANGPVGSDIVFAKGATTATDTLSFVDFSPLGIHALPGADPTPLQYFNYTCAVPGAGEIYKYVQFPISQGVQNLSAQTVSVRIYARSSSSSQISLSWRQFFGSGAGASADQIVPIAAPFSLTPSWQSYSFTSVVTPDATGKILGSLGICHNDGLFFQVNLPTGLTCDIDFIKPQIYLGSILPLFQYDSNDEIDSFINTPRTGDIRTSLNTFLPGWVIMNDGTIGDASSNATARASNDTFPLFSLIWNTFQANQALAPMFTSGGLPKAYGTSPADDYVGNNQITLTKALGRVMAGISPSHLLGTSAGSDTHTLVAAELPPHTHTIPGSVAPSFQGGGGAAGYQNFVGSTTLTSTGNGSSTPFNIIQPTVYMNVFIKL